MSQIKIQSPSKILNELDQVQFDKLYRTTNGITKATIKYHGQPLILQAPRMTLGHDVVKSGNQYYTDLVFNVKNKKSQEFQNLVNNLDYLIISEIFENNQDWYGTESQPVSLCQIEKEFIPTIKLSTMFPDQKSLKLESLVDQTEFYDQDQCEIPYRLLKESYETIPLLSLSEIVKQGSHIWVEWKLLQLKTDIPDYIFNQCQLCDVVDSSDEDTMEEDEFY